MKPDFFKLMLVTNKLETPISEYLDFVVCCAQAGLTSVQLREKNLSDSELLDFGRQLQRILKPYEIPLIVNDKLDVCLKLGADGLHLGQDDGDVTRARQQLGLEKILGLSINSLEQIKLANDLSIDYIGVGAIFSTKNKSDVKTIWGVECLKRAVAISKHKIIAIGGIDESNVGSVVETGVNGIAAIGVFHDAKCPESTVRNLRSIIEK